MKALFLGYRGTTGQVSRIEDGWRNIGEKLCTKDEEPDLIFCNDTASFDSGIRLKQQFLKAKLILNVLDIPKKYYPNLDLTYIKNQLKMADIVTCISKFSQKQIKEFLDVESSVIYNPIKDISDKKLDRDIDFLYVGRLWDPAKRFSLAVQALSILNIKSHQFFIVGPDDPGGNLNYLGEVDDFTLDMLYNRSKFLISTTEYEGLGLPAVEATICGCIPILCKDNPTAKEFLLENFMFDPNPEVLAKSILNMDHDKAKLELQTISNHLYSILNKNKIAQNIKDLL